MAKSHGFLLLEGDTVTAEYCGISQVQNRMSVRPVW